jgi:hypothetical protein
MPARCLLDDPVLKSMLARSTFVHMIQSYEGMYCTYERTYHRSTFAAPSSSKCNTLHPPCSSTADLNGTRYVKCVAVRRLRWRSRSVFQWATRPCLSRQWPTYLYGRGGGRPLFGQTWLCSLQRPVDDGICRLSPLCTITYRSNCRCNLFSITQAFGLLSAS